MFRILNHSEIDFNAWDNCVSKADNASLYGKSWYLNILAGNWKGIVKGDYEAVFPLIFRKKYGMNYICQPMGVPTVAWYRAGKAYENDYAPILQLVSENFDMADINLLCGEREILNQCFAGECMSTAKKQCLDMRDQCFDRLIQGFSRGHKYSIRKALRHAIDIKQGFDADVFWSVAFASDSYRQHCGYADNLEPMKALISWGLKNQSGQIWLAYNKMEPISAGFLMEADGVLYFLYLFTSASGLQLCANHLMTREIIRVNHQKIRTFDFGGSNIPSIRFFNLGFGAKDEPVVEIRSGRLRPIVHKLKQLGF
ncbi:hypothetical protein G3O08_14025 [Cryomorpha ignava]|uniref:GNAT family N-acetyltransferase n=1 Tax=Cryomorpha ignava TaxID=101383 RepID=A0A7K3WUN9_9FLAO|nr:hypothetical protein [Cryomorpha ignava]NEN24622.1 hypothetical protein [Cryomorpha ignava]